jgi:hypothetical protein
VARARGQEGRGAEVGEARGDAWACVAAGSGAWGAAPAVSGCGRSGTEGRAVVPEEDEAERCQGDLFVIFEKFRDPSVN